MTPVSKPLRWKCVMTSLLLYSITCVCSAQAPAQHKATPQEMLDFLARPATIADKPVLPPDYPAHYTEWNETQRKDGAHMVALRCGLVFSMEHDDPSIRMLPQSMSIHDESRLAMDVCFATNMPGDFTDRTKYLADAGNVIADAKAHGASLHLPVSLKR